MAVPWNKVDKLLVFCVFPFRIDSVRAVPSHIVLLPPGVSRFYDVEHGRVGKVCVEGKEKTTTTSSDNNKKE